MITNNTKQFSPKQKKIIEEFKTLSLCKRILIIAIGIVWLMIPVLIGILFGVDYYILSASISSIPLIIFNFITM